MAGTREDWAALLPTIKAFVDGKPLQKLDWGGRWVDADEMYSVLAGGKYRLKPDNIVGGEWTRPFRFKEPGSISAPVGDGQMRFAGSNSDEPKWPKGFGLEYTGDPVFTPDQPNGDPA